MDDETETVTFQPLPDGLPTAKLPPSQLILGVDIELLHKFLILFRDHYKKCEKATFFLENRTGIANVHGMANQRDAISHFSTALQFGSTLDLQTEQYINAVEHFRRAIFEPYEIAIKTRTDGLIEPYEKYKSLVAPVRDRYDALKDAPSIETVDTQIRQIADWRDNARAAKGQNAWNDAWEDGVEKCIDAFDQADRLFRELDKYCIIYDQIQRDEEQAGEIRRLREEVERLKQIAGEIDGD